MAEGLIAELFEALKEGDPRAYHSSGMLSSGKGWVLSGDTVREIAALQSVAIPVGREYADGGQLLGLPFRVDDSVDRFALETIEAAK